MAGKENVDPDLRDFQPPKKEVKTTREPVARFKCPTSDEEMVVLSKGFVAANTQKSSAWAMRVFSEGAEKWGHFRQSAAMSRESP